MLIAGMMTGLVGGCGAKGADQTEGTETAAEGATEEAAKTLPSHQIGETFTENINGTDVSFIMMDLDRAGVEMPVPSSLIDPTRYRGGVATEDDWNNYIICEPEDSEYQYYDASGYFFYVAGYAVGEKGCVYTNEDGTSNITDSVTLSDAQLKWGGNNDAFSLTTEPVNTYRDNGT